VTSRRFRWTSLLAGALAAACSSDDGARELDRRVTSYVEDEPGARALAEIDARLSVERGAARLEVVLDAVGPEVEPVPGFAGVRGSNRITARELTRLVREQRVALRTFEVERGDAFDGDVRVARVGPVPERRVGPDGTLELGALTREEFVTALETRSGPLAPGRYRAEVLVGDVPRLAVAFWFDGRAGGIERIDSHPVPVPEEIGP
jgi:hypothetical protein